ncbi:hypothetical protein BEK98_15985 [Streptomyces diastatochromogenes]|uniref:Uncharacterized protein n=1 Tax=Streptomyces diastatochromogenes TaxID=42236 RepID=A0A233SJ58_STRDA|nr:hypothetical protein BEK98_15985 [Streptomyces diastatochromogenes]
MAGPVGLGTTDLGLGAVDPQRHAFRSRVGEDVGQGPQPKPRPAGDGETTVGEQTADLPDGSP